MTNINNKRIIGMITSAAALVFMSVLCHRLVNPVMDIDHDELLSEHITQQEPNNLHHQSSASLNPHQTSSPKIQRSDMSRSNHLSKIHETSDSPAQDDMQKNQKLTIPNPTPLSHDQQNNVKSHAQIDKQHDQQILVQRSQTISTPKHEIKADHATLQPQLIAHIVDHPPKFMLQLARFSHRSNAQKFADQLAQNNILAAIKSKGSSFLVIYHQIFHDKAMAKNMQEQLAKQHISSFIVG